MKRHHDSTEFDAWAAMVDSRHGSKKRRANRLERKRRDKSRRDY